MTATIASTDIALVNTDDFIFISPDEILTPATRFLYLKTAHPVLPAAIYFQDPHGGVQSFSQGAIKIGIDDVLTPKGLFLAGQYFILSLGFDKLAAGVWSVAWGSGANAAPFYSMFAPVARPFRIPVAYELAAAFSGQGSLLAAQPHVSQVARASFAGAGSLLANATRGVGSTLLLHCDGLDGSTTFTDSSGHAHVMTPAGDAQLDTAQFKFGTASGLFDGTGDWLDSDTSADFTFGLGDFTIDFWVRSPSTFAGTLQTFYGAAGGGAQPFVYFRGAGLWFGNATLSEPGDTGANTTMIANTWYYVAATRASGVTRLFLDGVQLGSNFTDANNYSGTAITIAASATHIFPLTGWMDEIHMVKGTALYTANFTPPVAPYTF